MNVVISKIIVPRILFPAGKITIVFITANTALIALISNSNLIHPIGTVYLANVPDANEQVLSAMYSVNNSVV